MSIGVASVKERNPNKHKLPCAVCICNCGCVLGLCRNDYFDPGIQRLQGTDK